MAELTASTLSKSFVLQEIFTDVSFNLEKGDRVGIIGANGAGKTTLFNILSGKIEPDEGKVYIKNNQKIGYMLQNVHNESDKTIFEEMLEQFEYIHEMERRLKDLEIALAENKNDMAKLERDTISYNSLIEKYSGLGGEYFESRIEGILKGMGFPKSRFTDLVSNLSGGEKSRLDLAKLLVSDSDILLLDEPTNHLDMKTIQFVEQYIRDCNKLVVFISHDRYFLDRVANRIFLLENQKLHVYNMNYSKYIEQRKKDILDMQRAYENQQKEIARQEEIISRFAKLGGALRKRGISQSRSRQKLLDKMKKIPKPDVFDDKMRLTFRPQRESGMDVLSVNGVSMGFGDKLLYKDISFEIYKGEKVGLIGGNGTGKTTLFKMILNKLKPLEGSIDLGVGVFPEYFEQEQESLNLENTVIDEIWDAYPELTHYELRSYLAKFMFIGDDIFKIVGDLSGGERSRITLLKLMLSTSNFLLMDEPTNHLDIDSKEVLEDALLNYEATAFIISHDRYFLNKVCDKIILIENGNIEVFNGNYDYYMEKIEQRNIEVETISENKTKRIKEYKKNKSEEKEKRKIKARIREIEKEIENIDTDIEKLNMEFTKKEVFENHEKSFQITEEIRKLNLRKDAIYEEWINLVEE
ncbi:MAG: ABC-F family ATP-binding cassette domain-containing protein [Tissierellia bacterium]|nr:ABC-F family ATP-binding cassette domain-containing protein [Tissierellia bacterium]